jgi:hypothetical protein
MAHDETMKDVHERHGSRPATAEEVKEFEQGFGPLLAGDEEAHASAEAPGVEVSEASVVRRIISVGMSIGRDLGKIVANGNAGEAVREASRYLS